METYQELRELVRQLERKTGALNDSQMSCCSITMAQCHALIEIGRAKSMSLMDLSNCLGLDSSTLSRTVNHLVNSEMVNREIDPSDRRFITISLTHTGQQVFNGIETGMNVYYEQVLQAIPSEKRDTVLTGLHTLLEAFTSLEQEQS